MLKQQLIRDKITSQQVDLADKKLNDQHIEFLCGQQIKGIKILRLKQNDFTGNALKCFQSSNWSNLNHLGLWGNNVGNKGCKYLSRCAFDSLTYFGLGLTLNNKGDCHIQNVGIMHLCKMRLDNLKQISLSSKIGCDSMTHFLRTSWKKMDNIFLDQNKLSHNQLTYLIFYESQDLKTIRIYRNPINDDEELWLQGRMLEKNDTVSLLF